MDAVDLLDIQLDGDGLEVPAGWVRQFFGEGALDISREVTPGAGEISALLGGLMGSEFLEAGKYFPTASMTCLRVDRIAEGDVSKIDALLRLDHSVEPILIRWTRDYTADGAIMDSQVVYRNSEDVFWDYDSEYVHEYIELLAIRPSSDFQAWRKCGSVKICIKYTGIITLEDKPSHKGNAVVPYVASYIEYKSTRAGIRVIADNDPQLDGPEIDYVHSGVLEIILRGMDVVRFAEHLDDASLVHDDGSVDWIPVIYDSVCYRRGRAEISPVEAGYELDEVCVYAMPDGMGASGSVDLAVPFAVHETFDLVDNNNANQVPDILKSLELVSLELQLPVPCEWSLDEAVLASIDVEDDQVTRVYKSNLSVSAFGRNHSALLGFLSSHDLYDVYDNDIDLIEYLEKALFNKFEIPKSLALSERYIAVDEDAEELGVDDDWEWTFS